MLDTDTLFQERYRISYIADERPGCVIYRAYEQREQQQVLIAELPQDDETSLHHTRSLAEAVASVSVSGLLPIHRHFALGMAYYMLVKDPGGQDLERAIHEEVLLAAGQSIRPGEGVLLQIERMLKLFEALHQHQPHLLVGDMHSSDLWVSPIGELYLAPFALLRPIAAGSTSYRAPELQNESAQPTSASDVYALGAVCYHLLAGWPPPTADLRLTGTPLNSLLALNANIPLLLNQAIMRALALRPEARYQAIAEMRAALEVVPLLEGFSEEERLPMPGIVALETGSDQAQETQPELSSLTEPKKPDADSVDLPTPATCLTAAVMFLLLIVLVLGGLALFFMVGPGNRVLLNLPDCQHAALFAVLRMMTAPC